MPAMRVWPCSDGATAAAADVVVDDEGVSTKPSQTTHLPVRPISPQTLRELID